MSGSEKSPFWICPRCSAKLAGRNMAHACGSFSVDKFLEGKGPTALALWDALLEQVGRCGRFEFAPAKTRVALMVRVRFLAVTALSERGMTFHIWLRQPLESDRVFRIDPLAPASVIHWVRIKSPDDFDAELEQMICASYRVGTGED